MTVRKEHALVLAAAFLSFGCTGRISSPAGGAASDRPPTDLPPEEVGLWPDLEEGDPVVMRRLTNDEIRRTIGELLYLEDGEAIATTPFPPEERIEGYTNNSLALSFLPSLADAAFNDAETAAAFVVETLDRHVDCAPSRECAEMFIDAFGPRAWRRPLTDEERSRLLGVFDGSGTPARGIENVATSILISLPLFYRVEFGDGEEVAPGVVLPTSWEMASRLSYSLWGAPPDEELVNLARADELQDPDVIAAQVERMVDDPRTRATLGRFHSQWLGLDRIGEIAKDSEFFPEWDASLPLSMRTELDLFLDEIAWGDEYGRYSDLFTSTTSFVDEPLAAYYGISAPAEEWGRVELPDERRGVLARGGSLALHGFQLTSPVLRGIDVRERLLCDHLPPPPPTVDDTAPAPDPSSTTRDQITVRTSAPDCVECHQLMNEVGFFFEGFDAVGQPRTEENGLPIDDTGKVLLSDIEAARGVDELQQGLAESAMVRNCFVRQGFRFFLGRREGHEEFEEMRVVAENLEASGGTYRAWIREIFATPAFLTLPVE
ncbi:MAG: DUF1592 domain-containing protein [Myxococcota bacterium]